MRNSLLTHADFFVLVPSPLDVGGKRFKGLNNYDIRMDGFSGPIVSSCLVQLNERGEHWASFFDETFELPHYASLRFYGDNAEVDERIKHHMAYILQELRKLC